MTLLGSASCQLPAAAKPESDRGKLPHYAVVVGPPLLNRSSDFSMKKMPVFSTELVVTFLKRRNLSSLVGRGRDLMGSSHGREPEVCRTPVDSELNMELHVVCLFLVGVCMLMQGDYRVESRMCTS